MTSEIIIPGFTTTSLVVTAAICIAAVLVAWYTVRGRVKFSQIILGMFCYVLVLLLENLFSLLQSATGMQTTGLGYGLYTVLSVVLAREIVRFAAMRFGVLEKFTGADASIGFAIGFAGLYLLVCGVYYFSLYSTATEYLKTGMDAFLANSGEGAEDAMALLESVANQSGWEVLATGVNRVFFLVREISLCLMLYYAMQDGNTRGCMLVPVLHLVAMIPDGLYQAELLHNSILRDAVTCVLSAGIAFLASRQYNAREDQVAHFRIEHLYAKRRR